MRRSAILAMTLLAGCASATHYQKSDAIWGPIQKIGIFPFLSAHDDPVRRELATKLFATELRKLGRFEVVELPAPPPAPFGPNFQAAARKGGVDAYIEGTVGDMWEILVDLKLTDAASGDILWSSRYHRGAGPEFSFRFNTPQQQLQRIFEITLRDLNTISRS